MEKNITQELCEKIEKDILSMTSVSRFYVGKTDDVERRQKEHLEKENLQKTLVVAIASPIKINEIEKKVIEYFKEKEDSRIINKGPGGEGPNGKFLYVSLNLDIKDIHEIDDLDIEFDPIIL